jgi:hypothetical protein
LVSGGSSFIAMMALFVSLATVAGLLGLLVERLNKRHGDAVVITRIIQSAAPEPSFRAYLSNNLILVREHFDTDMVRLAIQEVRGEQAVAWEVTRLTGRQGKEAYSWNLAESALTRPKAHAWLQDSAWRLGCKIAVGNEPVGVYCWV